MAFNGTEGASIALELAAEWTSNYRNSNPNSTKAHFFGIDILKKILQQENCIGIRMYYALNDSGEQQLILVGADAQERDQTQGTIADFSSRCPNNCDPNFSPLSS
jgi:hypothetical protein